MANEPTDKMKAFFAEYAALCKKYGFKLVAESQTAFTTEMEDGWMTRSIVLKILMSQNTKA